MIRFSLFIIVLYLAQIKALCAQQNNLFDEAHTKRFASYLYYSGQYAQAIGEFERLLYFNEQSDSTKYYLISAYQNANKIKEGITAAHRVFGNSIYTDNNTIILFSKLLAASNTDALILFASQVKNDTLSKLVKMQGAFQSANWKDAEIYFSQGKLLNPDLFEPFKSISEQSMLVKHRSPFAAAAMSTLVPGTGKVYTGNWKDGLVSAIMISATTFQAYQGYSRKGFDSPKFWIFGTFTAGFYFGNIYGSVKSAQKFNKTQNDAFIKKSRQIFMALDTF